MSDEDFRQLVWQKGKILYRPMPWRDQPTLYFVLVSELMLQQTQVARVLPKFAEFVQTFPGFRALAAAELSEILCAWQGLGYNRRAKYLHQTAKLIAAGTATNTILDLVKLPGIGVNTAAAIMNYVYEVPISFVETNIRTVFLNHFFVGQTTVSDKQILQVVERTIALKNPRRWFWALMDYGAELKSAGKSNLQQAVAHRPQSKFDGSLRQMRGEILRRSTEGESLADITTALQHDSRFAAALAGLRNDGLL